MQILVSDTSYDHEDEVDRKAFVAEAELQALSPDVSIRDGDVGQGASEPVIVATLAGLFFLGKPINENLDAWLSLAKKFATAMKWLAGKALSKRIDESGASLIAVRAILDQSEESIRSLELLASTFIPYWTNQLLDPGRSITIPTVSIRRRIS